MPDKYTQYFNNMLPGQTIDITKAQDIPALIQAIKDYIDNGGDMQVNNDWKEARKLYPWPEQEQIKTI